MHRPSLKALQTFEVAARLGSLTAAARELNVTVSAVAFQVRQVEQALGAPLFTRSGRAIRATAAGRALASDLKRAFDQVDDALARVPAGMAVKGRVTISVLPNFASLWLLPRLSSFRRRFPAVDVVIEATEERATFSDGTPDCAIRCGPGGWPGVTETPLFPQRLAPMRHRNFRPDGRGAGLTSLPHDRYLIVNQDRPGEWKAWFAAHEKARPDPSEAQRLPGREIITEAVRSGTGVGLMDCAIFSEEIQNGEFVPVGPAMETGWTHSLVVPEGREPSAASRAFIGWILEQAA